MFTGSATQSCLNSLQPHEPQPGSSICGILQEGKLEWGAVPFSRGSSWPRDWTRVSYMAGSSLPSEPPGKPSV